MIIDHFKFRKIFADYWISKDHKEVPPIPLVPKEDPTTLFTGSGMQQLVPYFLGEVHPLGKRLYNAQRCIRAQDIDEVGDNRHDSFFEMMGNWSLGDYYKKEQIPWFFLFLVKELRLDPNKLYVTAFKGKNELPQDTESIEIWKKEFEKVGIKADIGNHIHLYGDNNWWSRAGTPDDMPSGEPGGPDSEVFFEFTQVPHDKKYGETCHPNCECGRFLEIGNSVFIQYKKNDDGTFSSLPKMNVDFGGGLERLMMAVENNPDMFATSLFSSIIKRVETVTHKSYAEEKNKASMRIIADHLKAAVFLIKDGVLPSNKEQGYILRRLIRRLTVKMRALLGKLPLPDEIAAVSDEVLRLYNGVYFNPEEDSKKIKPIIAEEIKKFSLSLEKGLQEIKKLEIIDGKIAFDLYQNYGFPVEITRELYLQEKGIEIDNASFMEAYNKHRELSRSASAGKFKGGLADNNEQTIKYHTATHLLHQALFDVLGSEIRQEGSNISGERLRFDFYSLQKPTEEQLKKVAEIVNKKIALALPVTFKLLPKKDAEKLGAKSFFRQKYPDMVKVYFIGDYSKEFCGGPHVTNTKEIGGFTIIKCEKIGSTLFRIYAK